MIKNLKLALGLGIGLWAVMFIGVSAFMVMPIAVIWQRILEIILSLIASFVLGRIYFKKNPGNLKDALILGAAWFIVGGILDLLITVQYVKASYGYVYGLQTFYGMWSLWVGFVMMFAGLIAASRLTASVVPMKMSTPKAPVYPQAPQAPVVLPNNQPVVAARPAPPAPAIPPATPIPPQPKI